MSTVWKSLALITLLLATGCRKESAPSSESPSTGAASDSGADVDLGTPEGSQPAPATETPEPAAAPATTPPTGAAAPPATSSAPAAAAATAVSAGGVDLNHVSDQAALALVVRPQQALNNPVVQGVIREMEAADPKFKLADRLAEMRAQLGMDVSDMDQVLVVFDQRYLAMIQALTMMSLGGGMGPPGGDLPLPREAIADPGTNCDDPAAPPAIGPEGDFGPPGGGMDMPPPVVVVKFKQAVDGKKLAAAGGAPAEERTHSGQTYYFKPGDNSAAWFSEPTTAILSSEEQVKGLIDGQKPTAGPLAAVLAPLADKEFAFVIDVKPLHEFIGEIAQTNPGMAMVGGLVKQVNLVTLTADLQGANLLQLQLHTMNENSAAGMQGMLGGLLQQGQMAMAQQIDAGQQHFDEAEKVLAPFAQKVVNAASVTADGAVCSVTVPRPAEMEELPKMIRPLLDKAQQAKSLNSIRQLGLAFHNYADTYRHFPASGGPGNPERPGQGLSWRVHLLPYMEEYALYQEFKLDEPWDSEHNKTLIARMPGVFGSNPEGKTSLHVFVGEGTPFDGDKGRWFDDITDGTSNTILFVEAGPSTADVWTKPGGLAFDAANPLAALGDIGEQFAVVMMDGAARKLSKTIDPATFRNLVQHADGQVITLD